MTLTLCTQIPWVYPLRARAGTIDEPLSEEMPRLTNALMTELAPVRDQAHDPVMLLFHEWFPYWTRTQQGTWYSTRGVSPWGD